MPIPISGSAVSIARSQVAQPRPRASAGAARMRLPRCSGPAFAARPAGHRHQAALGSAGGQPAGGGGVPQVVWVKSFDAGELGARRCSAP